MGESGLQDVAFGGSQADGHFVGGRKLKFRAPSI